MQCAGVLSHLDPDPRVARVEIRGRIVEVRPLRVERMPAFLRAGAVPFAAIFAGETVAALGQADPAARVALVADLLEKHQAALVDAIAIASGEHAGDVAALNAAELLELLTQVLEVNLDFFARSVAPALGRLALSLGRIQSRMPSAKSSAAPHSSSNAGTAAKRSSH